MGNIEEKKEDWFVEYRDKLGDLIKKEKDNKKNNKEHSFELSEIENPENLGNEEITIYYLFSKRKLEPEQLKKYKDEIDLEQMKIEMDIENVEKIKEIQKEIGLKDKINFLNFINSRVFEEENGKFSFNL